MRQSNSEYDEHDDETADDEAQDNGQDDEQDADAPDALQAVAGAAPEAVDAHRDMLSEVFQTLEGRGVDTSGLAAQAGVGTTDPSEMSHGDLISTTMVLAREHPEVLQTVSERFPAAQGILGSVLGGSQGGGGGLLGGLLRRL